MKNILLVDDDQTCNFIATKALQDIPGVKNVHIACDGQQAINVLTTGSKPPFHPDIILLDLNMPGMNGFDFLIAFSKLEEIATTDIKIIVISSSKNIDDIDHAKSLGASDYVPKPLTAERLRNVLSSASG